MFVITDGFMRVCSYKCSTPDVLVLQVFIYDRTYSWEDILDMEMIIVERLEFNMSVRIPYCFMRRFLKAAGSDKKLELLPFFLIELSLVDVNDGGGVHLHRAVHIQLVAVLEQVLQAPHKVLGRAAKGLQLDNSSTMFLPCSCLAWFAGWQVVAVGACLIRESNEVHYTVKIVANVP